MRGVARYYWMLLFLGVWLLGASEPQPSATNRAKEILDRIDDLYRGTSAHGRMTMKVVTAHWTREMSLEFWAKGKEKSLIRILAPAKEKGTATLKVGNDIWNFLPKVKRTIKIPSSMMGGSWMGSHFTNDDLVKESRMADDYDFSITFEGQRGGLEVIDIACIPKPQAAVVWGKVVATVRTSDSIPLQVLFYDEDQKPARTMFFSNVRKVQDRLLPTLTRMVPADKPGEFTEITYQEIEFDQPISGDLFSLQNLER
jgi:Outer membrane lipoprotein-sorting protein